MRDCGTKSDMPGEKGALYSESVDCRAASCFIADLIIDEDKL